MFSTSPDYVDGVHNLPDKGKTEKNCLFSCQGTVSPCGGRPSKDRLSPECYGILENCVL